MAVFVKIQIKWVDVKTNDIIVTLKCDLFCSLKLECEKLASEKTEMQRHYVMVSLLVFLYFSKYLIIQCKPV